MNIRLRRCTIREDWDLTSLDMYIAEREREREKRVILANGNGSSIENENSGHCANMTQLKTV